MNAIISTKPPVPAEHASRSAWARALWAAGVHDSKEISRITGHTLSATINALRTRDIETAADVNGFTRQEYARALELVTGPGAARDIAAEVATEFARIRQQKGRAA